MVLYIHCEFQYLYNPFKNIHHDHEIVGYATGANQVIDDGIIFSVLRTIWCITDCADLAQEIENLSPATKENLGVLLRSISKGEGILCYNNYVSFKEIMSGNKK